MNTKGGTYRLMGALLALDIVCLIVSGILKNTKHGAGNAIGTVTWIGFLALSVVLVLMATYTLIRGRRTQRATA
jgi:hypothetical protein